MKNERFDINLYFYIKKVTFLNIIYRLGKCIFRLNVKCKLYVSEIIMLSVRKMSI